MNISNETLILKEKMAANKQYFWDHPEIAFEEYNTSKYIFEKLKEIGFNDIQTNIAKTGIVATLKCNSNSPCIAFRADMDAVIMDENNRMKHTCGHDSHMTSLLALAELTYAMRDELQGTIKFIFQPAEEGDGGAKPMIDEGVLNNVDKIFAVHVWSELPENTIGIKSNGVMASTDPYDIEIIGKGGHGALPEKCINPVTIASEVAIQLTDISEDGVLGITCINSGSSYNVIPDKAFLKGLCRSYTKENRAQLLGKISDTLNNITSKYGANYTLTFPGSRPTVINSEIESKDIYDLSKDIVGTQSVITEYKTMCSEDFSFFLENVPGALIFIGCGNENSCAQHNENFTVNIDATILSTELMYAIAKKYLKEI